SAGIRFDTGIPAEPPHHWHEFHRPRRETVAIHAGVFHTGCALHPKEVRRDSGTWFVILVQVDDARAELAMVAMKRYIAQTQRLVGYVALAVDQCAFAGCIAQRDHCVASFDKCLVEQWPRQRACASPKRWGITGAAKRRCDLVETVRRASALADGDSERRVEQ